MIYCGAVVKTEVREGSIKTKMQLDAVK